MPNFTKPFLVLQLRPETEASDSEFTAILRQGHLKPDQVHRVRLDQNSDVSGLCLDDYSGIIVGGGPGCVSDPNDTKDPTEKAIEEAVFSLMPEITERDLPYLGCCYGIGILGHFLGGIVNKENYSEPVGAVDCSLTPAGRTDPMLKGVAQNFRAFVGHKEAVQALPPGCTHLVTSGPCPFQMIRYKQNVYATQFHPEADPKEFELRIKIYRDKGYFPSEDADKLTKLVRTENVTMPEKVLRNFVAEYASD
ncbi:MAG TPA: glutamine amidotransferase [Devosia sp.]|nr:glutamine amidotransferase [Devosia sp.]